MEGDERTKPEVLGTASVVLRPLRYMFDVEAELSVTSQTHGSPTSAWLEEVHVRLVVSTRLPLIERHQFNGFFRSEQPNDTALSNDREGAKDENQSIAVPDEVEEISSLLGTFVWLLVNMQVRSSKSFRSDNQLFQNARVQYQVTAATESFLLPIEHTNVMKLLVTEDLLDQINTKSLVFTFLSPVSPSPTIPDAPPSPSFSAPHPVILPVTPTAAKLEEHFPPPDDPEIILRHYNEAKERLALEFERERLEFQQKQRQDERDLQAMAKDHAQEKHLLQQELQHYQEQQQQLSRVAEQLETQLQSKDELFTKFQQSTVSNDQTLELLKRRMASDAAEREELQRRLRTLEEEKLALLNKSRACAIQ